jgi:hypothetical protein
LKKNVQDAQKNIVEGEHYAMRHQEKEVKMRGFQEIARAKICWQDNTYNRICELPTASRFPHCLLPVHARVRTKSKRRKKKIMRLSYLNVCIQGVSNHQNFQLLAFSLPGVQHFKRGVKYLHTRLANISADVQKAEIFKKKLC